MVPAIDPVHLAGFLAGCKIPHDEILVVDNAARPVFEDTRWDGQYVRRGRNMGVAGSWNIGASRVIADQLDWLIVASTSFRFGEPGGLDFIAGLEGCVNDGAQATFGWHFIAIARETLLKVGPFDEQFWPAYCEDTDYLYRMGLLGLASPRENGRAWCQIDMEGDFGRQAATLTDGLAPVNLQRCVDMYEAKWGGPQGQERFVTPYGRPV